MMKRHLSLWRGAAIFVWLVIVAVGPRFSGATAFADPSTRENPMPPQGPPTAGNDAFARALFARLASRDGNVVVSPTSVELCVALALAGANGQTAARISQVLQAGGNDPINVGRLLEHYAPGPDLRGTKRPSNGLVVANSVWVQQGFPIHDAYRKLLETNRRATFELADFAAKTEAARQAINAWVNAQTNHKIKELLASGSLDRSARLVLANAIYFKGQWARPFSKSATTPQPFHRPGQADVSVPLMHMDAKFRYLETASFQAIELPYSDGDMAMVVWLPKKTDALAQLERDISAVSVAKSLEKLAATKVDVFLPKFKVDNNTSLGDTLSAMGMKDAFSPKADFSGITDEPLWISAVVHQALVEVDEEGTEAAAATGAIAVTASALPERELKKVFRADHPFVFAIRNRKTGDVLFVGRVINPTP
jgi:serine protease inhibitor